MRLRVFVAVSRWLGGRRVMLHRSATVVCAACDRVLWQCTCGETHPTRYLLQCAACVAEAPQQQEQAHG
jgi:hypothetical protein